MPKMKNFNKTGHEPARRIQTSIRSIACIFRLQPEAPHPIRRTGRPRLSDTTNDDVRAPDKRTIPRGSRFSTYRTTGIATSRRIDAGRRNRRRIVPHVTSALMKDKHYLYRVAVTCYVDSLFYETGNARRCHDRCHSLITQTLCGIGKAHAATICATTVRNSSRRYGYRRLSKNFCICTFCWSRNVRRRRRQLFCKNSAGCWKSHSVMRAGRDRNSPPIR